MVDALNIRAHETHMESISMYRTNLKDKIIEAANSDQHYLQIKENLQEAIYSRNLKIMN
jgi:hypothetical protein